MMGTPMLVLTLLASTAEAAPQLQWRLTVDGLGPVRIGMTQEQVSKALGSKLEGDPIEDENVCVEKILPGQDGVWFMFEEGKLTRISVGETSRITTPRGIGVGASAAQVRHTYPRGLKAEAHKYEDRPAEYLTYWTVPGKRGVRFETDRERRVQTIHAGTSSIEYIEGCA